MEAYALGFPFMTTTEANGHYFKTAVQVQNGARTGVRIVSNVTSFGRVEVEGLGNAAGARWYAPIEQLTKG